MHNPAVELNILSPDPEDDHHHRCRDDQQEESQPQLQQEQEQQQQRKKSESRRWWSPLQDSKRVIHAIKVGLALSLSSLFMLVEEPPSLLGQNAIWAIMTVVVVFEFTVGATLSKGLNRGLGTLAAAFVGLGASHLADFFGHTGEAAVIIASVFITAALATFLRFIPKVKAKYDYGLLIFILTFSLISVSSYRNDDSFKTAATRMFTILVGCGISLVTCMFLLPVWAGEDLHNLVASNLDIVADCIQGSVDEFLKKPVTTMQAVMEQENQNKADNDAIYVKYQKLLCSGQTEESLANFAGWEPPHGKFLVFGYPWKQYVKVGAALRHCAYASMAMHGCLRSELQAPYEMRQVFRTELMRVTADAVELLQHLGASVRSMLKCDQANALLAKLTASTELLQESIDAHSQLFVFPGMVTWLANNPSFEYTTPAGSPYRSHPHQQQQQQHLPRAMSRTITSSSYRSLSLRSLRSASNFSLATFTSLLIETVARVENLVETVESLGDLARFKAEASQTGFKPADHRSLDRLDSAQWQNNTSTD